MTRTNEETRVSDRRRKKSSTNGEQKLSPDQLAALVSEAEQNAQTAIRAAIATGRPEALVVLELTLAATHALLCAMSDWVPSPINQAGFMLSIDDEIEQLVGNTRCFYRLAVAKFPRC